MNRYYVVIDDDSQKAQNLIVGLHKAAKKSGNIFDPNFFHILDSAKITDFIKNLPLFDSALPEKLDLPDIQPVFFIDLKLHPDRDDDGYILLDRLADRYGNEAIYILNSVLGNQESSAKVSHGVAFYFYDQEQKQPSELLPSLVTGQDLPDALKNIGRKTNFPVLASQFRNEVMGRLNETQSKPIKPVFQKILQDVRSQFSEIDCQIKMLEDQIERAEPSISSNEIGKMINRWISSPCLPVSQNKPR
jgi:hypothetical protein